MDAKRLKKKDIKYIAKGLLHDFKEPSEFKNAKISGIWPIYFMQAFNQYLFRKAARRTQI